tara:strand:- start:3652 stop:4389 length:738 start_codon:yes stop_codon:yes gene_type:complete
MTKLNPNGLVVYEGPSRLDNKPIVVVATGLKQNSTNAKTGAMIQTYILRQDIAPAEAVKSGQDASICGNCVHRGDGTGKGRSCYVTLFHGPRGVYGAYSRGSYAKATLAQIRKAVKDRMVRLGTYGDPAAVPLSIIRALTEDALGHTGYTHQWRTADQEYSKYCMASADSEQDMLEAHKLGYRTFRVTPNPHENIKGLEVVCPASEEAGRKTSCVDCRACMGTSGKAKVSIQIAAHGVGKKYVTT